MRKILATMTFCLFTLITTLTHAASISPFRATYVNTWNDVLPIQAEATQELKLIDDGQYELRFSVNHVLLSLTEVSFFGWQHTQIRPKHYEYRQNAIGAKREHVLQFDWKNKQVTNTMAEYPVPQAIPSGTLDNLTYQLQLRNDLKNGKKQFSYAVFDKSKIKNYVFKIAGREVLDTTLGKLNTIKLERVRKPGTERTTTLWLAKELDYLLVKLKQIEGKKTYELVIKDAIINGTAINKVAQTNQDK